MTADVAFESPQEVADKLTHYEELFKHRYTEKDEGYRMTVQRKSWWYQVPEMHPWPPRKPFPFHRRRYEDWDGGHRRGYHRPWGRERGGYYGRPRYRDDRGYRWGERSRSPIQGSRSPRDDRYRERSPHSPRGHYWPERDSPSPRPPSHPHHLSPQWEHGRRSRSPGCSPIRDRRSPVSQDREDVKGSENAGSAPKDQDRSKVTSVIDLEYGESKPNVVPSESDVFAILSTASSVANEVTSENLKKVQKEAQLLSVKKEKERKKSASSKPHSEGSIHSSKSSAHSSSLLITHGKTESVLNPLVVSGKTSATKDRGQKHKKKRKVQLVISDDEEPVSTLEHVTSTLDHASSGAGSVFQGATCSGNAKKPALEDGSTPLGTDVNIEPTPLILKISKNLCSHDAVDTDTTLHIPIPDPPQPPISQSATTVLCIPVQSLPATGGSTGEMSVKASKKKKKKKTKQHPSDEGEKHLN